MRKKLLFMTVLLAMFIFTTKVNAYEDFKLTDEIVEIISGDTYQVNFTGNKEGLKFVLYDATGIATINEDTGLLTLEAGKNGVIRLVVQCNNSSDSDCYNYLHSVNANAIIVINKDTKYNGVYTSINTAYTAQKTLLQTELGKLTFTDVEVAFTRDLLTHLFEITNDKGEKIDIYNNYGRDFVSAQNTSTGKYLFLHNYTLPKGIQYSYYITDDDVISFLSFEEHSFRHEYEFENSEGAKVPWGVHVTNPKISGTTKKLIYATGNAADKKEVLDIAKTIPVVNKSYLNADVLSKFSVKSLSERQFENSQANKIIKDNKLDSYLDPRYGDSSPMSPFFGGFLVLGKNGIFYTAQELKVWSTLKLPKNAGIKIEQNIKEYFESYLDGDYTIKVEKDLDYEGVFRVFMTENKKLSFVDKILSLFAPRVYADDESVITFAVEEVDVVAPKEPNPPTGDNILLYSVVAGVALAGVVGGALYLNKKSKDKKKD